MRQYILGAGTAGIITSLFTGSKMIDGFPLGELSTRFSPGIRIFKYEKNVVNFITSVLIEADKPFSISKQTVFIGYKEDDGIVCSNASEDFKRKYSLITRGKEEYEKSFLSSAQTHIDYVSINNLGYEQSYQFFFKLALDLLKQKDLLIEQKVLSIDTFNNNLYLDTFNCKKVAVDTELDFDECISTLSIKTLFALSGTTNFQYDLSTTTKSFYKCKAINHMQDFDEANYIYSIGGIYTRKTLFDGYIVYETKDSLSPDTLQIEGNWIVDKYENLPLQIKNSLKLQYFNKIKLIGRYAQWDHSIKANEIINSFMTNTNGLLNAFKN